MCDACRDALSDCLSCVKSCDVMSCDIILGGTAKRVEIGSALEQMAVQVTKRCKLDMAGIDVLMDSGSYKICEVTNTKKSDGGDWHAFGLCHHVCVIIVFVLSFLALYSHALCWCCMHGEDLILKQQPRGHPTQPTTRLDGHMDMERGRGREETSNTHPKSTTPTQQTIPTTLQQKTTESRHLSGFRCHGMYGMGCYVTSAYHHSM